MANYTDTLTYSVTHNGRTYADTIEETISTVVQAYSVLIHCGTSYAQTELIEPDSLTSGNVKEFDPEYCLFINRDASQILNIALVGTDTTYFQIPPLGFMKFHWDGSGTYEQETSITGTRTTFTNVDVVYGWFANHDGLAEVLAIAT